MIPEQIINSYSEDEGISKTLSLKRFIELEEFFQEAIDTNQSISPSDEVDSAWHHFLKYPGDYESYCASKYGVKIHHITSDKNGEKCHVFISKCTPEFQPLCQ